MKKEPSYQVVPAAPGWFALQPVWGEEPGKIVEISREPVLAWCVEVGETPFGNVYTDAVPICADAVDEPILERPDGTFLEPYIGPHPDLDSVTKRFEQLEAGHVARARSKAAGK